MDTDQMVEEFLNSWIDFKTKCERRAKDRAKLTKECWKKLMCFHTEKFLSSQENPFGLLFYMKHKNGSFYRYYKMNSFYYQYLHKRNEIFKGNYK